MGAKLSLSRPGNRTPLDFKLYTWKWPWLQSAKTFCARINHIDLLQHYPIIFYNKIWYYKHFHWSEESNVPRHWFDIVWMSKIINKT
jgi:hypothetical protein